MSRPGLTIDPADCEAIIFDMDGVLTDTAVLHARAWKEIFDEYLERRARARGEDFEPFDIEADYRRYVDGKPRQSGVRSFLASRGIRLEAGEPDDAPDRETVCGLGNRKNERFLERLREEGARRFEDAIALVRAARRAGIRTAVISASRNARTVLERAGIADLFDARVDGAVADEAGLEGKPAPDVLLEAARRLGADPSRAAIVEDSRAGLEAGRAGGFAWVIGVARGGDAAPLREAGAGVVVRDLSEIEIREGRGVERPIEDLPSALDRMEELRARIGDREVALFLDFDGTLAPIVDRPEDAALPAETRTLLGDIASRRTVAVVSGRDLDDLRDRVGLDAVYYAGSHGFRLAGPGGLRKEHERARRFLPALDEAEGRLEKRLASMAGVQVDRKRYAVAVHFRRAPADAEPEVRRIVGEVREGCGGLRVSEGRRILELRPDIDWHKGRAIRWLLDAIGIDAERAFPVYVGDDVTDEDAFAAVSGGGLAIVVHGRDGRTRASLALADLAAVRRFLARLDAEIAGT